MFVVAAGDALVPPVPSDSVVVAVAAVSVAADGPHLLLLAAVAPVGALFGDTTTFLVGRRLGHERLVRSLGPALLAAVGRASDTLERRGAVVILVARYVPVGRVAVNLTAGATAYPPRRFVGLTALAALTWSVGVGALPGRWVADNPLLGAAVGIAVALMVGLAVDRLVRGLWGRARASTAPNPGVAGATTPGGGRGRGIRRPGGKVRPLTAPGAVRRARRRLHSPPESANNGVGTLPVRVTILTGPVRVWCPGA